MTEDAFRSPSGSDTRQRRHLVTLRCDAREAALLVAKAERAGMSRSAYLRATALGNAGPRAARHPVVEKVELARLLGMLGQVTADLDRLRWAMVETVGSPPLARLDLVLLAVEDAAHAIMKALGRDH